jgi:hypothetical protein
MSVPEVRALLEHLARGPGVGRRRDPAVVGVASRAEPAGRRQPPQAKARGAAAARRKE